jgi:hypothetical protein
MRPSHHGQTSIVRLVRDDSAMGKVSFAAAVLLAIALVQPRPGGAANASAAQLCNREEVANIVRQEKPDFADIELNSGGISGLRCFDFTSDGTPDVLLSVFGGGTGGNMLWGFISADGGTPKLTNYSGGGSHLGID